MWQGCGSASNAHRAILFARKRRRRTSKTMKAQRMKAARMLKNLTQQSLAQVAGCTEALVSKIETGRATPERELKERIARALEIETWEVGT